MKIYNLWKPSLGRIWKDSFIVLHISTVTLFQIFNQNANEEIIIIFIYLMPR